MFAKTYDWMMGLAKHRNAPYWLAVLSFTESSFFLVPPDVMLIPMALGKPEKAYRFALITTVMSVLGGVFGYLIGMFAFELIEPLLQSAGYWEKYLGAKDLFAEWGIWVVFIAGFSPFPYKIITITAGVLTMNPALFVIASIIGRGSRFFLVAGFMAWGGPKMEPIIKRNIERLGWTTLGIGVLVAIYLGAIKPYLF